jgi:hypothetical protein
MKKQGDIVPKHVSAETKGFKNPCIPCQKRCKVSCIASRVYVLCAELIGCHKHFVPCDKDGREIK